MSSSTEFLSSIEAPSSPAFPMSTPPSSDPPSIGTPARQQAAAQGHGGERQSVHSCTPPRIDTQKRRLTYALPSSESNRPTKKVKKTLTTISVKREKAVEDLHAARMLQLARASRDAFAMQVEYRKKRIHELDIMRTIAHDEYEEAASVLHSADLQIGEMRHVLATNGIPTLSSGTLNLKLSPIPAQHHSDSSFEGSFYEGSASSVSD